MSDPKINSILDEGNRLFLKKKFIEAIQFYDRILTENSQNLSALNNKGYALSKLKEYEKAIECYNTALTFFQTIFQFKSIKFLH